MKIKKKAKRISSVALCVLMLLTALPITAITANAAAQAYIKYIDTEVYIGDVFNIIVGVNGGSTGETFTYQWQMKYVDSPWINLTDETQTPDSPYKGLNTNHFQLQTKKGYASWSDLSYRCRVTGSKSGVFYSDVCKFPPVFEKTEIPTIGFLGLEKPEQRKIPSTTATPINSTYYSFDYIEWYEYKNNKVGRKLNDGEAFDSGMYCCQLYFNMNRGYAVAKNAVCGLYNDDGQATILQDETTGQYYIWAYYVVADKSPSFSHQFTEAEIMKGKEGTISVTANNAASYQWQMKVRRRTPTGVTRTVWLNISDNSSTSNKFSFKGTKTNALTIRPNTDFDETHFRCAVTGENGDVIYSVSVKVTQEVKANIIMNLKTGGSPDDTITVKVDRYTFDGVYKDSFEHDMENSNVKPLYFGFQTFPGKHVITVSKPQCIARVYEIYLYKDDISFDVNITVPYDVNMDGVINVVDATLVQKYIVGLEEFDDYTFKIADTNGDGTISVIDATNIQKKIVNLL